jgi:methanogenic corrinoid protein MtbC1
MATSTTSVDTEIYQRSVEVFRNKRNALAPNHLKDLAAEVVHRLVTMRENREIYAEQDVDAQQLSAFCDALLHHAPERALSFVANLQAQGVTRQHLRFGLIAGAARLLGERWDRDEVSFVDVTVATGHLYAVMRAVSADLGTRRTPIRPERRAIFASVPGETHTLGVTLAADAFRDAGWEIELKLAESHDSLIQHADQAKPLVIGLSLSTKARLPELIRLVLALRIVTPSAIVGVAPALDMSDDDILQLVDADIVFRHAGRALADLERRLRS